MPLEKMTIHRKAFATPISFCLLSKRLSQW
jgi:hypothetical protein